MAHRNSSYCLYTAAHSLNGLPNDIYVACIYIYIRCSKTKVYKFEMCEIPMQYIAQAPFKVDGHM